MSIGRNATFLHSRASHHAAVLLLLLPGLAQAEPLLGFSHQLTARRSGSPVQEIEAFASGTLPYQFFAKASTITGTDSGYVIPSGFTAPDVFGSAPNGTRVRTYTGTDPFFSRMAMTLKTAPLASDDEEAMSVFGSATIGFGDLIRVNGPGDLVPVTFTMGWTYRFGSRMPSRFPATAIGYGSPDDVGFDYYPGGANYAFALRLEKGLPSSGGGSCGEEEEEGAPCFGGEDRETFFNTLLDMRSDVRGEVVWDDLLDRSFWRFLDNDTEVYVAGDGTYSGDLIAPRWFPTVLDLDPSDEPYAITWTHTALIPVGEDLYFSGGWSIWADIEAPNAFFSMFSMNSAALGIILPAGYTLESSQGMRYAGPGSLTPDPGGDVPEPATWSLLAAGLGASWIGLRKNAKPRRRA